MPDRTPTPDHDPGRAKPSRRRVLGWAAAATAGAWSWRLDATGAVVRQPVSAAEPYRPLLFSPDQIEAVARLADALIPRTDTPGARDARVHEYLDLALSVAEEPERQRFLDGLSWADVRSRSRAGAPLHEASAEQITRLLREISDEHAALPAELEPGGRFFADLKRRTVLGYYTSFEGRTKELGRPETVTFQRFRGCTHRGDH
ncbi:MAG TPA: gluconate 2-dehydrogenase subunit 3 family protein [Thermoanaerobaculia bacterium]|nr:gluconate 2-dehydrogenase subunit 3 family protein [Thermoanaerobaculia bacterium]